MDTNKMERGVKLLLEGLGADLNDRNFRDTPRRVARMYRQLFTPPRAVLRTFPATYDDMVVLRGHVVYGVCPHHLLPFGMRVYLGYLPAGKVLGLSKLPRLVESLLTGPVLQESFTHEIVRALQSRLGAKGVACTIASRHGCMQARGVKTRGDIVTSTVSGIFLVNPSAKAEFMHLIGNVEAP